MVFDPHKDKKLRLNLKHYPDFFFHLPYKIIFRDKNARPGFCFGKNLPFTTRKRIFPESLALFIAPYWGCIADEK